MAWKTFKFFEKEILKDPETKQPFEGLADLSVTCVTGGRGQIVVGDAHGRLHFLHMLGGQMKMSTHPAYQNAVLHLLQLKQSNLLISVGFEDPESCMIKIWDSAKVDRGGGAPIRTIKPQLPDKKPVQITCISVDERQSLLAVGYVNGCVVLIKGNLVRYWSSKTVVLPLNIDRPITGLAFSSWKQDTFLFITTELSVFSFRITANLTEHCLTKLGDFGCRQGCCILSDSSQDNKFVVSSNEVTSFYLPVEAAQCFGFEGIKLMVNWFRGHLLEVKKLDRPAATPSASGGAKEQNVLTVYDVQNQFIAFSITFSSAILGVVPEWGMINVLTSDGRITHLKEHDTQSKLESLFKRNLFDYAVNLARNQSYDDGLAEILRRYGDHLYSKGDFRGAIEQYKNAIRFIEPSYVIRKFLDAQQIENLTSYLKALHDEGMAKSDHTTLLLNCYTKLQDEAKLEEFIRQCRPESFDVEAAIRVCRQAGFHTHAVQLAAAHAQHNLYVLIQVEDLKKYKDALLYIEKLSFDEAQTHIKKYGKSLMAAEPELTAALITSLCLGHWKQGGGATRHAKPEEFIHIFVNQQGRLVKFLESSLENIPKCSPAIYNTLLELYLSRDATRHTQLTDKQRERKIMVLLEGPEVGWDFSCRGYVHQPMSTSSLRQTTMFTMLWCWLRCTTSKLPCFTSMSTSSRCTSQSFSSTWNTTTRTRSWTLAGDMVRTITTYGCLLCSTLHDLPAARTRPTSRRSWGLLTSTTYFHH
jgi:tetratricopeptide (TPR) repeat protein